MEKGLCLGSLAVAVLLLIVFLLDLVMGMPFGGGGTFFLVDLGGVIGCGLLAYLALNALKDVK